MLLLIQSRGGVPNTLFLWSLCTLRVFVLTHLDPILLIGCRLAAITSLSVGQWTARPMRRKKKLQVAQAPKLR